MIAVGRRQQGWTLALALSLAVGCADLGITLSSPAKPPAGQTSQPGSSLTGNTGVGMTGGNGQGQAGAEPSAVATDEHIADLNAIADDLELIEAGQLADETLSDLGGVDTGLSGGLAGYRTQGLRDRHCRAHSEERTGRHGETIKVAVTCGEDGTITRTMEATDAEGNLVAAATQSVTITVDPPFEDHAATGSITATEESTFYHKRGDKEMRGSEQKTGVAEYDRAARKMTPVSEEATRHHERPTRHGLASIDSTHRASDFRPPANVPEGHRAPPFVPNRVVSDASITVGDKSGSSHMEATGNRFDGLVIEGTRTLLNGKTVTFKIVRNPDGTGTETIWLANGNVVTITHNADGSKTMELRDAEGNLLATMTVTAEGRRHVRHKRGDGQTVEEETGGEEHADGGSHQGGTSDGEHRQG